MTEGNIIQGSTDTYELIANKENYSLKTYDYEYGMWVVLNFKNEYHPEVKESFKERLKEQYIYNIID